MTIPVRFGNVEEFKYCQSVWRLAHHLATLHQLTAPVVQQPPINQLTGRAIGDFTWANRSLPPPRSKSNWNSLIFHISYFTSIKLVCEHQRVEWTSKSRNRKAGPKQLLRFVHFNCVKLAHPAEQSRGELSSCLPVERPRKNHERIPQTIRQDPVELTSSSPQIISKRHQPAVWNEPANP